MWYVASAVPYKTLIFSTDIDDQSTPCGGRVETLPYKYSATYMGWENTLSLISQLSWYELKMKCSEMI